jgi:hypothetical protein
LILFSLYISVRVKFSIPEDKTLTLTDDGGTEVDADVFPELVTKYGACP